MKKPHSRGAPVDKKRFDRWLATFRVYRYEITKSSIESWLKQFDVTHQDLAARVLDAVDFYAADRIAEIFRAALKSIDGWSTTPATRKGKWRFAPFTSSAGESGDSMLHQFRMANKMSGRNFDEMFIYKSELVQEKLGPDDTVVFLDDFVATGEQACTGWSQNIAELTAGVGNVYLIVVAAVARGRKRVTEETAIRLLSGHELDEADNMFSGGCKHFTDQEKSALLAYGQKVDKKQPKGFGDCGLVVVFQHRCPNNSIPVLHGDKRGWTPLFQRHG